ncbi:MAG TPA: DUF368 domain-containing protein [Methanocorpusculum sp.]|nr:DUF368 domain-containing protein [Methanocorpusculum sp.]
MKLLHTLRDIVFGACMAVADSVPGVSGGTIAFLLGFYEKFIASINDFLLGPWEKKKAAIPFLLKLAIGWVCCFAVCAILLSAIFNANIYALSSLFLGLSLLAIPIIIWEERAVLKGKYYWLLFTAIGVAIVPLLVQLNGVFGITDISHLTLPLVILLLVAGMLAISVMILPGISGSTMLLIFGLYVPLITAVSAVLHLDFSCVPALLIFIAGVIIGLSLCTKLVRYCFERFRAQTIYLIIGLLIGSLYAIVKGPETVVAGNEMLTLATFSIWFFLLGAVIMILLEWLKLRLEKRKLAESGK